MAKRRDPKLKVFQAQFGFYDTVVAARSQAAALRAWGTHQNLFTSGEARLATDEVAVKSALEHPQVPLRRAIGSKEPFALEPTGLPSVPDQPDRPKATGKRPARPADRSKLDAAEDALRELDDRRKAEEAELRREEEALEAKKAKAQEAYVEARKAATASVMTARQAYRKSGAAD